MTGGTWLTGYNLAIGVVTCVGVLYILYAVPTVVAYRRSLLTAVGGLVAFLIGGPLAELLVHPVVHWVHAVASLLVIVGLYGSIRAGSRPTAWRTLIVRNRDEVRRRTDWMQPIDETILRLLDESDLVLTPSVIAYNVGHSRAEVNRRLIAMESRGFLVKVDRGKYRIGAPGRRYLRGPISRDSLARLRPASIGFGR